MDEKRLQKVRENLNRHNERKKNQNIMSEVDSSKFDKTSSTYNKYDEGFERAKYHYQNSYLPKKAQKYYETVSEYKSPYQAVNKPSEDNTTVLTPDNLIANNLADGGYLDENTRNYVQKRTDEAFNNQYKKYAEQYSRINSRGKEAYNAAQNAQKTANEINSNVDKFYSQFKDGGDYNSFLKKDIMLNYDTDTALENALKTTDKVKEVYIDQNDNGRYHIVLNTGEDLPIFATQDEENEYINSKSGHNGVSAIGISYNLAHQMLPQDFWDRMRYIQEANEYKTEDYRYNNDELYRIDVDNALKKYEQQQAQAQKFNDDLQNKNGFEQFLSTTGKSFEKWGDSVWASVYGIIDALDFGAFGDNPQKAVEYFNTQSSTASMALDQYNKSHYSELGANVAKLVQDVAPDAFISLGMAYATGGASLGAEATTKITSDMAKNEIAKAVASKAKTAILSALKNPNFYWTFLREGGSAYNEAVANGADETQALIAMLGTGFTNSMIEIGGGIEKIPKNSGGIKNWLKEIGRSFKDEGLEELAQGITGQLIAKAVYAPTMSWYSMAEDGSGVFNLNRMWEEFIGGAIGGGMGGFVGGGINTATNRVVKNIYSADYMRYGIQTGELDYLAEQNPDTEFAKEYIKLREQVVRDGNTKSLEKVSNSKLIKLANMAQPLISKTADKEIESIIFPFAPNMNEEQKTATIPVIRKLLQGEEISIEEATIVSNIDGIKKALSYITGKDFTKVSANELVEASKNGTFETVSAIDEGSETARDLERIERIYNTTNRFLAERQYDNDLYGKPTFEAKIGSESVTIEGIDHIEDGEVYVKLSNGVIQEAQSLDTDEVTTALLSYASEYDTETASAFIGGYSGNISVGEYARSFAMTRSAALTGLSAQQIASAAPMALSNIGQTAFDAAVKSVQEKAKSFASADEKATQKAQANQAKRLDKVSVKDKTGNTSTKEQKRLARYISKATGYTVTLVDSRNGYINKVNGVKAIGEFNSTKGEIVLDIGSGNVMATALHEVTHYIKLNAPEEFNAMAKYVVEWLTRNGTLEEYLDRYASSYKLDNIYDLTEEMTADVAEALLKNADFVEDLFTDEAFVKEICGENRTFAEKFVDALKSIIEAIKNYLKNGDVNHLIAGKLSEDAKALEEIKNLWEEGLKAAVRNHKASSINAIDTANGEGIQFGNDEGFVPQSEYTEALAESDDKKFSGLTYKTAMPKTIATQTGKATTLGIGTNDFKNVIDEMYNLDILTAEQRKYYEQLNTRKKSEKRLKRIRSFNVSGEQILKYVLLKNENISESKREEILSDVDSLYDFMQKAGEDARLEVLNLNEVNNARVYYNPKTKEINLSAMVKNGDYPINFDLTTICKKRVNMQRIIDRMVEKSKANDNGTYTIDLSQDNLFALNKALSEEGFDTACLGCFVESKRYNISSWANTLVDKYNKALRKAIGDEAYKNAKPLDFAKNTHSVEESTLDDKAIMDLLQEAKEEKEAYTVAKKGKSKNDEKFVEFIKTHPEFQGKLQLSDVITSEGIENITNASSELRGLIAGHYGSGTPKMTQGFVPYNSEIALLMGKNNDNEALKKYLHDIGGVRLQSFSDFRIEFVMDYYQMFADLAARGFSMHSYTKEMWFAILFGKMGAKINLSVMFNVRGVDYWRTQREKFGKDFFEDLGLKMDKKGESTDTNFKEFALRYAGLELDDEGNLQLSVADKRGGDFYQSISFEEASKLQEQDGYRGYIGIVGVGYGDELVKIMLADDRFKYVIPYHKSGLPKPLQLAYNLDVAHDYTNEQNTLDVNFGKVKVLGGKKGVFGLEVEANGKKFDINTPNGFKNYWKTLKQINNGDIELAMTQFIEAMDGRCNFGGAKKNAKGKHGQHAEFDIYSDLEQTQDPRTSACNYIDWCMSNGKLPMFWRFAGDHNYYKLNYDYTVYKNEIVNGKRTQVYAPQKAVEWNLHDTMENTLNDIEGMLLEQARTNTVLRTDERTDEIISRASDIKSKNKYEELAKVTKFSLSDRTSAEYDLLTQENEELKAQVEALKNEMKLTKGHKVNPEAVKKLAKKYLKDYSSTADIDDVSAKLKEIFDYVASDNAYAEVAQKAMYELAYNIINNSETLNTEMRDEFKDILDVIKSTPIYVDSTTKAEIESLYGDYNSFRKSMFGRMRLTTNKNSKGLYSNKTVDSLNQTLSEMLPGTFPADVSEGDALANIVDFIEMTKPTMQNEFEGNVKEAAYQLAAEMFDDYFDTPEIKTFADKQQAKLNKVINENRKARAELKQKIRAEQKEIYEKKLAEIKEKQKAKLAEVRADRDEKLDALRKEKNERISEIRKEMNDKRDADVKALREQKNAELAEVRADREAKLQALREVYKERNEKKREKADTAKLKARIAKLVKSLSNDLLTNSQKHHIPEELKKITGELLANINLMSAKQEAKLNSNKPTKVAIKMQNDLNKLRLFINDYGALESDKDGNNNYTINFDPDLDANIKKFEEYLQMVVDKGVINIRDMNIEELTAVHNMLAALRKAVNDVNKAYSNRLTQAITEIAEGSIAEINAKRDRPNLDDGIKKVVGLLDNYANFQMLDSRSFFYNMGDSSFKIHQALRDGLDIRTQKLQEAQAFFKDALSSFTKKEIKEIIEEAYDFDVTGGKLHMTKAQIMSLYELNKREQGKEHIYKGGIRPTNTKNKRNPKPIMVNQEDVLRIVSTLSDEDIKLADSIQKFLAKNCAAWGNEVTMDMYGYKKFVEEFYFPITSFDAQVNTNDNNASNGADKASMFTILNYGMTKALTPNANNAIDISNIFDVATKHIVEMSNYAGYAKPLSDAMRWFNYRNRSTGESVKGSMYAKYENKGKQYFVELIKDINNQKATGDYGGELTSMLVSGAKTASIAANLSVVVQQPTAYVRASAVLNPDILMKGAVVATKHIKKSMAEVKQYCPIAYWKSQGYFDTSLGKSINETITGIKSKKDAVVEASMSLAGLMDDVTWAAIWESTKIWVQENHPDVAVDSQAFFDIASEKFRDVVDQTQVVDTVLHRPMILRSKNALVKMSFAFMSEPLKSANLVRNAALDMRYKKPGAKHKFVRALASSVLANLAAAATKAIIMALRDTGDDDWLTKWLNSFLDDAKNSINPFNLLPIVKDIISMLKGFDVERMDMTAIAGIVDFAKKVFDYAQKDKLDDLFNLNTVYTLTRYLSQLTGVPVYNVLRDVDAFIDIFGDPIFRKPNTSTSTRVQKLYDAAMANDTEAFNNVYNTLKSEGKTQKEIESSLKSKIIDDSRGNAMFNELVDKAAKERINGNISESVRIVKELANTTALSADFWKACVNARINKLNGRSEDREVLISTGISRELVDTMTDDEVTEALKSYQTDSISNTSDSLTEDTGTVSMYTANDLVKSIEDGDYNEYSEMYQDMLEVKVTNLLMKAEQENKELTVDEAEEKARKSIKSSMTDGLKKLIKSLYNSDKAKYKELKKWLMKNLDYSSKTIEGWLTEKE